MIDRVQGMKTEFTPQLDEIKAMGFNAIEFMPWIAWPDSDAFSWGYDPISYFAVEISAYCSACSRPSRRVTTASSTTGS